VYDLFEHMNLSDSGGGKRPAMGKRGGKPSRKKATVSSQFKVIINILIMLGVNADNSLGEDGNIHQSCVNICSV